MEGWCLNQNLKNLSSFYFLHGYPNMSELEYLSWYFCLFWGEVSFYTLTGLELPLQTKVFSSYRDPLASASWVLESKTWAAMLGLTRLALVEPLVRILTNNRSACYILWKEANIIPVGCSSNIRGIFTWDQLSQPCHCLSTPPTSALLSKCDGGSLRGLQAVRSVTFYF